jgi:hypothetical protein
MVVVRPKFKPLLGKCTNYFSNIGVAEFTMQSGELHIAMTY